MATEYIDTSINPADYIEVWEVEDAEHGKQLVMAVDDLKCLPLEDVRSVILCKDCVMYRRDKELAEASYLDPNYYCGLLQSEMPEDGFCSYGKRRGGDADG